ncbi:hypothetical protein [uncultured Sphaerochaeta sp.]|uniref:hypothetical protein n=1 Tax=uncultured Sphaerochaeta sp. TaxID=886478 RepID=UPI00261F7344|nr:hypothetical protein [uncultured Sphaerochaeta sp.]
MPIEGFVTASEIIEEAIDRWGETPKTAGRARAWVKRAMLQIGALPEVFGITSCEVYVVDGTRIPKPDDVFVPYSIYLCKSDGYKIEAVYSGRSSSVVWNRCCPFYYMQHQNRDTILRVMDGGDHYFFPNATEAQIASDIKHVELTYITFPKNEDGELLVPLLWQEAVQAFIDVELCTRARNRDRRSVAHSEVEAHKASWIHARMIAYGRSKMPNIMELKKMARQQWATRIVEAPKYER